MQIDEILRLIEAVAAHDLSELSLERDGTSVRIVRQRAPEPASAPRASAPLVAEPLAEREHRVEPQEPDNVHVVTSPIVGTFYTAPSASAEPYVRVGDRIKKGQVLCIVEAMKLMNEIESDVDGAVVDVLIENAQPVEYAEALFRIRLEG